MNIVEGSRGTRNCGDTVCVSHTNCQAGRSAFITRLRRTQFDATIAGRLLAVASVEVWARRTPGASLPVSATGPTASVRALPCRRWPSPSRPRPRMSRDAAARPLTAQQLRRRRPPSAMQSSPSSEPLLRRAHARAPAPRRRAPPVAAAAAAVLLVVAGCLCVAPLVTPVTRGRVGAARAAPGDGGAGGAVRLITWNVFMRPQPVGAGDKQEERLTALVDGLAGFEVGLVQELFWLSGKKQRILDALAERGVPYYAAAPMPGMAGLGRWPPKLIDGGVTITSAFPIEADDYMVYDATDYRSIDSIVAKGVLYAKVRAPQLKNSSAAAGCLHVFSTHAQASNGLAEEPFKRVRAAQQREMVKFVQEKVEADVEACAILLGGDFNSNARAGFDDSRSSSEYEVLIKTLAAIPGLADVLYEANNGTHPVTSAGGLDGSTPENERLDYIFFAPRKGGQLAVRKGSAHVDEFWADPKLRNLFRTVSDHFAVTCILDAS